MIRRFGTATLAPIVMVVIWSSERALSQDLINVVPGSVPGALFGSAIARTGDLDGDSHDDIVVGAYADHSFGNYSGAACAISGKTGQSLWTAYGTTNASNVGRSVAGIGDVDMDGFPDVVTGDRAYSGTVYAQGMIRVHSGVSGQIIQQIPGDSHYLQLGYVLADAGDFDQDGQADILASSLFYYTTWGIMPGLVRVYAGQTGQVLFHVVGPSVPTSAPTPATLFGYQLAVIGDADGDGWSEVAVGAPSSSLNGMSSGRVHVFSGKDATERYSLIGNGTFDVLGSHVRAIVDLDADGVLELSLLAGGSNGQRRVDVRSGAGGAMFSSFLVPHGGSPTSPGIDAVSDLDGDGLPDLLIGEPADDLAGSGAGKAAVYSLGTGKPLWAAYGLPHDDFGIAVAAVGDVDNDGAEDFAVGAAQGANNYGEVYIYSGSCAPPMSYGVGCLGPWLKIPTLTLAETCVKAGAPQTIQVKDGIPNATAYLLFGTGQANVPVGGGCSLLVSPVFPLLLPLPLSASGSAYLLATIPPFLSGVTLTMQALIPDPNGSGKFASSRGLEMEIP